MLVKLDHGASVNVDNLKYITIDIKRLGGQTKYVVLLRIDDNTDHPIAYFDSKEEALKLVKKCVKNIKEAD